MFIRTSPFRKDPQYSRSMIVPMRRPCYVTSAIFGAALAGLRAIYQPGYRLAKARVMLLDIQPASREQFELDLGEPVADGDLNRLIKAIDSVNGRWGKGTVKVGSGKVGEAPRDWGMWQDRKTPGYTTARAWHPPRSVW